jgi:hypothetical protein
VERWNGIRWTLQAIPGPRHHALCGYGTPLEGVSCTSARYCVAVGADNAYAWNGRRWRTLPRPSGAPGTALAAVSCAGPGRCAAVGGWQNGTLLAWWNGHRWSVTRHREDDLRFALTMNGVSCTPDRYCMAVGTDIDGAAAIAYWWNGKAWSNRSPRRMANLWAFYGISCTSRRACVTSFGPSGALTPSQPVYSVTWNGRAWSLASPPLTAAGRVTGISCVGTILTCTMVGLPPDGSSVPFAARNYPGGVP